MGVHRDAFSDAIDGMLSDAKDREVNGPPLPEGVQELDPQRVQQRLAEYEQQPYDSLTPADHQKAAELQQALSISADLQEAGHILEAGGFDPSTFNSLLAHFDGNSDKAAKAMRYIGPESTGGLDDAIGQLSRTQQAKAGRVPEKVQLAHDAGMRQVDPAEIAPAADPTDAFLEYASDNWDTLTADQQTHAVEVALAQAQL